MPTEHFENQYFLADNLRADLRLDVQAAGLDATRRLLLTEWADAPSAAAVSVHHLQRADRRALPCSLSGAIVLRDLQSNAGTLYLHSPWGGLETFTDMLDLTQALNDRLGRQGLAWSQIPVATDCFVERMQRIFADRLARLEDFWQDWTSLPRARPTDSVAEAEQALGEFWAAPASAAGSRREQLAAALEEAYQHTLIEATHERLISRDEARWLQQAPLADAQKASLYVEGGDPIKLAGAFVLHDHERAHAPWFLYLPEEGLHHCTDEPAVLNTLTGLANLGDYLSLDDHATLQAMPTPLLRLDPPSHELFIDRANSIIGLQRRNLAFSLSQRATGASVRTAIDVTRLIDPTLLRFSPATRALPPAMRPGLPLADQAQGLQAQLQDIDARLPDLTACATQLLDRGLACMGWHRLSAVQVSVQGAGSIGTLPELLVQRVTATGPTSAWNTSAQVPKPLLDVLLSSCVPRLEGTCERLLKRTQEDNLAPLADVRLQALRLELQQQRLLGRIDKPPLAWLEQLLLSPTLAQRDAAGEAPCRVYALAMIKVLGGPTRELDECLALSLLESSTPTVLYWSALAGLQTFPSWQALYTELGKRLGATIGRREITGHFAEDLQNLANRQIRTQAKAVWGLGKALRLAPAPFTGLLAQVSANTPLTARLDQQISELRAARLEQGLPAWLKNADAAARREYAAALQALEHVATSQADYRFDIPPLHAYARERILERFRRVQPDTPPDPDRVHIELPAYTAPVPWLFGHLGEVPQSLPAVSSIERNSLTAYAISHFSRSQTAVLRARMADGSKAPGWMTPPALHQLVDRLDIGGTYRQLLAEKFNVRDPAYSRRRELFAVHSRAQLRLAALQARLAGELDARAWAYVQAVLDMPDGMARQKVGGQIITLRPMTLIPAPGHAGDRVAGLCLIGPADPGQGPLILYVGAGATFVFKQFDNDADLLQKAQAAGPLQDLIVQQVDEAVRSRYAHGGLHEAHLPSDSADLFDLALPAAQTALDSKVFGGNAWQLLFDDRVHLLQQLAKTQTVSSGEAQWQSFQFLMGLSIEQVGFVAEGRLGKLLALWAGVSGLDSAAVAASQEQWGDALGRLAYALFLLAPVAASASSPVATPAATPAAALAQDTQLQDELQEFETFEALDQMIPQPASGLYQGLHGREYAAVAGKVYPVWEGEGGRRIGSPEQPGPWLKADEHGQWQLERLWDLRYGGFLSKRARPASPGTSVSTLLNVRAVGMKDIRRMSMDKARRIGEAHSYAKRRLETALDNLNVQDPSQPLAAAPRKIIADFFGVAQPSPQLLADVKRSIGQLYVEMIDPSLSPWSSPRYVYAENLATSNQRMMGMISLGDPARRIFVTELFFKLPSRLRYHSTRLLQPFNLPAHTRAATLIHEVAHLVNDCEDIAYIEPGAPYPDLIDVNDPLDLTFKDELLLLADRLSVNAPQSELFMRRDHGHWVSLDVLDPPAAQRVIRETGAVDLDHARQIFYADADRRAAVILANADSVAMLVMLLGRPDPTA